LQVGNRKQPFEGLNLKLSGDLEMKKRNPVAKFSNQFNKARVERNRKELSKNHFRKRKHKKTYDQAA
jgi:hypothetical protein